MYLQEYEHYQFPPVTRSSPEGIVATGGNLSPGMLISAYSQGIFPWYGDDEPILWWSPNPRFMLYFENLHVSASMGKILRQDRFTVSFDVAFSRVIESCKYARRPGQDGGTWITDEMKAAYIRLNELGYCHSVEVWSGEELAGGLYGISLGSCFFGESMFTSVSNGSKTALICLAKVLEKDGFDFIDSQVHNPHMASLGAANIPRERYMRELAAALKNETRRGSWTGRFPSGKTSAILMS